MAFETDLDGPYDTGQDSSENRRGLLNHPDAPTRGLPGFRYRANRLLGLADRTDPRYIRAPEPNLREQAERSEHFINAWCDVVPNGVFATVNAKGGSAKTCTIVNVASLFAMVTGSTPLLIDANPASGTSAQKVGRDYYQTITVQELLQLITDNPSVELAKLLRVIKKTRYGLRVVSANPFASPDTKLYFSQWNTIFELLTRKFPYIFVDMGNEIWDIGAQTLLKRWIDVLLVTANVGDRRHPDRGIPESLEQMAKSEKSMVSFGVDPVKVSNALGVFSNGRPSELQRYLDEAVFLGPDGDVIARHEGHALVVPHDPYLSSSDFNRHGVNLEALNPATVEAYRQVILAAMSLRHQMRQYPDD